MQRGVSIITGRMADDLPNLGIDLGGSKILAAVVALDGRVLGRAKVKTKPEKGYAAVLERMRDVAREALIDADIAIEAVGGIGVGVPGPVDGAGRELLFAANLGWQRSPLAADLEALLGRAVVLGNDVNLGGLGEARHGAGRGAASCFAAFMGTGLGGALVLGGEVLPGAHGFAGEFGHLLGPFDHAPCGCGQRGCLETVASKTGMGRLIAMEIAAGRECLLDEPRRLRSSDLRRAWDRGCPTTVPALERAARALGWGLSAVRAVVDPERYVLGGGVLEELGAELQPLIAEAMAEHAFFHRRAPADLRMGELGGDAVVVGAAVAAAVAPREVVG